MVIPQLWSPCLYQSILFATEESNLSKMQLPCQHPFVKKKKKKESLKCWVKTRTFPITGYIKSFPTCPKYLSSPFHTCWPNHGVLSSLIFVYGDSLPQIPSKLSPYVPPFPFTCLILPLHLCSSISGPLPLPGWVFDLRWHCTVPLQRLWSVFPTSQWTTRGLSPILVPHVHRALPGAESLLNKC